MSFVAVVIPVYKHSISLNEEASFRQVLKLLKNYPIILFTFEKLDLTNYREISRSENKDFYVEYFNQEFFNDLQGYNSLLTSFEFYKRFQKFKFILIYQLDAWIFRDELKYWCNKGYDYIGAPWFEGLHLATNNSNFIGVGNGGFSLRKVRSHIKLLKRLNSLNTLEKYSRFNWKGLIPRLPRFLKDLKISLKNQVINRGDYYEDIFFCLILKERINNFKSNTYFIKLIKKIVILKTYNVSSYQHASQFSFEVNERKLYKENNNQLPFGCHAWEKYAPEFWKQFIKI